MLRDHLHNLYDFNCWGRDLLLAKSEALTPEQFDQDTRFPIHTIKETLVHTMSAEMAYRKRCMGELITKGVEKEEFPDLNSIRVFWAEEEKLLRLYLSSVEDDTLTATVKYKTIKGDEYERVRLDLLFQLLFHSMQHRAEIAQMLTEFGQSPGNIDYTVYKYG
ncbi:MAG: DinB family protein [Anaerolineales bacterium]